jgi:hypothetical protein
MTRWCSPGEHNVRDDDAQAIGATNPISGPGVTKWACLDHIRALGLVPVAAHAGRRDAPPIAPPARSA